MELHTCMLSAVRESTWRASFSWVMCKTKFPLSERPGRWLILFANMTGLDWCCVLFMQSASTGICSCDAVWSLHMAEPALDLLSV